MRSILLTLLSAIALLPGAPATAQAVRGVYALTGVTVVPMDRERLLPGRTAIVRDGRIAAIGPVRSTRIPAGAIRIEGRGRYLMPGLAEMHAHVPAGNDPQWTKDVLFLYAANGIVEGNPLEDVANLRRRAGVMIGGRWLPQAEIEAGLAAIAARRAG